MYCLQLWGGGMHQSTFSFSFVSFAPTALRTVGGGRTRGSHASRHAPAGGGGGHYARRPPASWDQSHHVGGSGAPSSLSNSTSSVYYLNGYQGILGVCEIVKCP